MAYPEVGLTKDMFKDVPPWIKIRGDRENQNIQIASFQIPMIYGNY